MFNNAALDVFIGLVVIYLLYSLLVTIISEMIATWMALRSRVLRVSIEKMLNDGYFATIKKNRVGKIWVFIQRYFLKEFKEFKTSFAGKFYQHPSIKYLSNKAGEQTTFFSQTKPSYITDKNFSETLIQLLKDKGNGITDFERIGFCLRFNTHQLQNATLKLLRDMAENAGGDVEVLKEKFKAWYNETQDRATGWYKRKLQLILFWLGFLAAVIFNVDSIQIARILSKDKEARGQLVSMGVELAKDSVKYKDYINGSGDSLRALAILDSGYSRVMTDIDNANLVLGLGWETDRLLKPFACEIKENNVFFSKLSANIADFKKLNDNINLIKENVDKNDLRKDSIIREITALAIDTLEQNYKATRNGDAIALKTLVSGRKQIDSFQNILNIIKLQKANDSFAIQTNQKYILYITRTADSASDGAFKFINSIQYKPNNDHIIVIAGKAPCAWYERTGYVVKKLFSPVRLMGLFVTALMLSLGAPFWFDLLKKLVSLRGSGVKPEETKVAKDDPANVQRVDIRPNPLEHTIRQSIAGDIFDKAILTFGPDIKSIPGVKSIFKIPGSLQINVIDTVTQAAVLAKFPQINIDNIIVPYKIVVSGTPQSHLAGLKVGEVYNESTQNGFGSLGCVVENVSIRSRHILSCWHVLKGNADYDNDDNFTTILDHKSVELASRWAGGIEGPVDYSLAQLFSGVVKSNTDLYNNLNITRKSFRSVTNADINNQIPIQYYDYVSGKKQAGVIYTDAPSVDIVYSDKIRGVEDMIILSRDKLGQNTISQSGNSGSIVFDNAGFAIAMIIAGDNNYTYAIKLSNIFSIHTEMQIV